MHGTSRPSMIVGLALATASGCVCEPGFIKPREIEFEPQAELRALAVGDLEPYYLVDAAGRVTILDRVHVRRHYELAVVDTVEVSSRPLVDVVVAGAGEDDTRVWVVDEAGTVHASLDAGRTWTSHPLDTELEPRGLVRDGYVILIYGDEFVRALNGDEWFEPPIPDGGWGSLRTATTLADPLVLSDGESLLLADGNPLQDSWQRIEVPTEVLTLAGGGYGNILIGGREGRVLGTSAESLGPDSTWDELQLGTDADVVALEGSSALTNAGELFDLDTLTLLDVGDANVGMAHESGDYVIFGADGPLITTYYEGCARAR
jgi:hypothetical protein